jgi:hypothetical protein
MTTGATPIWQEPVRGFYTDAGQFVALSGLDYLHSLVAGGSLPPPIGYFCGLRLSAVEPGSATFTMPVTDWLLSPQGVVSGATLAAANVRADVRIRHSDASNRGPHREGGRD